MSDDILDSVLDLEEIAYQSGFDEGKADGAEAGHREGMVFGIEKGYQKAVEMGKLHGRALMLNSCLSDPIPRPDVNSSTPFITTDAAAELGPNPPCDRLASKTPNLPTLPQNSRLKKHVETLLKLTDPHTLSLENSDEAVDEFDDRMRKATAKAKVIDKLIVEPYNLSVSGDTTANESQPATGLGNIEELSNPAVRH